MRTSRISRLRAALVEPPSIGPPTGPPGWLAEAGGSLGEAEPTTEEPGPLDGDGAVEGPGDGVGDSEGEPDGDSEGVPPDPWVGPGVGVGVGVGAGRAITVVASDALLSAAEGSTTELVTEAVAVAVPPGLLAGTV
jgi:hypothetical protein